MLISSCGLQGRDAGGEGAWDESDIARLSKYEAQLDELESGLEEVGVYRTILDNELQYTRGLDRQDEELIDNSFWPDAEASYGEKIDMETFAEWANEEHAKKAAHQHHVTGISLDINGDTAHAESYIIYSSDMDRDTSRDTGGAPTPGRIPEGTYATLGSGRYLNRYEQREGDWKIRVHEYVHEISMRLEAVDLCAVSCLGRWDTSDISYLRPLQPLSEEERRRRKEKGRNPHAPK